MKRGSILSLVVILLLAATPAMAAKGGKPTPHGAFDVALSGVVNTTCTGGTIPMTGTVPGTLRADLSADVAVGLDLPIAWDRAYDAGWGVAGDAFTGCHGISDSASDEDQFGGVLILDVDSAGEVTSVILLFDYYWRFGANPRNGRPVQQVLELFSLKSNLLDGTREFTVTQFAKEGKDIVNDWTRVGSAAGSISATISPTG